MPDKNHPSPPDDARGDDPSARRDPVPPISFTITTRLIPRERTALSCDAVRWLLLRAGGMWGRFGGIPTPLTPAFLDHVDETEPVAVLRAHLERADFGDRGPADVLVALCSFAPTQAGSARLINELVCRPEDYVRVAHGTIRLADWTQDEFERLRAMRTDGTDPQAPADALPEGTIGVVRPDGSVELRGGETRRS